MQNLFYSYDSRGRITNLDVKYIWDKYPDRWYKNEFWQTNFVAEIVGVKNKDYIFPFNFKILKTDNIKCVHQEHGYFEVIHSLKPEPDKIFYFNACPGRIYLGGNLIEISRDEALESLQSIQSFSFDFL